MKTSTPLMSGRPLLDTRLDSRLFVPRNDLTQRIETALGRAFNVLLVGDRGSGKTSTARSVMFNLRRSRAEGSVGSVGYVAGGAVTSVAELLRLVLDAVADRPAIGSPTANGHDPVPVDLRALIQPGADRELLRQALGLAAGPPADVPQLLAQLRSRTVERPVVVVLDDVDARVGNVLFGVYRDELWDLGLRWLVTAQSEDLQAWLAPPADAFFETVVRVPPLQAAEAREVLERRLGAPVPLPESVAGSELTPRELLGLARLIDPYDAEAWRSVGAARAARDASIAELGGPAQQLARALDELGPISPSDPKLLTRLGWTRARVSQVVTELEQAGLVARSAGRRAGPGRPPQLYRLVPAAVP